MPGADRAIDPEGLPYLFDNTPGSPSPPGRAFLRPAGTAQQNNDWGGGEKRRQKRCRKYT